MTHHLKTKPEYFQAVIERKKPFEIRYNDRNFQIGDRVILEEYLGKEIIPRCGISGGSLVDEYCEAFELGCCTRHGKCGEDIKHNYTGQRCLIQIKDIFNLNNAGQDLIGYVAFTFDILAINGNKPPIEKESVENLKFVCQVFERALNNALGIDHAYTDAYKNAEQEIIRETKQ